MLNGAAPTVELPAGAAAQSNKGSRRRRLWELPAAAHDLLLGLLLTPELLRRTVAQAIGRERAAICRVAGSEVEVLYSVVHDLGSRNAVSEVLHKLLEARQPAWLRVPLALDGLTVAWAQALAGVPAESTTRAPVSVPTLLWALLTHPHGAALQDAALRDARCWLFSQTRELQAQRQRLAPLREQRDSLVSALDEARLALQKAHAQAVVQAEAAAMETGRLRGELARALAAAPQLDAAAPAVALAEPRFAPARPARLRLPTSPHAGAHTATYTATHTAPQTRARLNAKLAAEFAAEPAANPAVAAAPAPRPPGSVVGQQVLCVGGIHRAVHRYRALIEARGGHFDHHDGGIEDSVQRLDSQLAAADVVLCQAGCLNHEAYQCVKAHCKRLGKPCLYLQRPSLSHLVRGLGTL